MKRKTKEEFWARIDRSGGVAACWPWLGVVDREGYGQTRWHGRQFRSHRQQVVVLCDPPYGAAVPDSTTRGARDRKGGVFTGYSVGGFGWADQVRLRESCCGLARLGALVVATNSWSDEVAVLYPGFARFHVGVRHSVGAKAERRGKRAELLLVDEAHAGVVDMGAVRAVRS